MLNALRLRAGLDQNMPQPIARPQSMTVPAGSPQLGAPGAPAPIARPQSTMVPMQQPQQPMMPQQQQQPLNSLINFSRPPVTASPVQGGMQMPQPGQPAPQMAMAPGDLATRMNALRGRMAY